MLTLFSYTASQADVTVFAAITSALDVATYPNIARWYKHIKSYQAEFKTLPGSSTGGKAFETTASAPVAAAEEEEEEVDLFGSDDEEEDKEAERIKAERLAEYNAKKAKKPKPVAKVRSVEVS